MRGEVEVMTMSSKELCELLGISESTLSQKFKRTKRSDFS